MDWEAWRDEFPILSKRTYLNSCSLGALSKRVRAAVNMHLDQWDEAGASAWYDRWMEAVTTCRRRFAALVNAREDEVALAPNVSTALGVLASAISFDERRNVVASKLDFPTSVYQWLARRDANVVFTPPRDALRVPPEALADAAASAAADGGLRIVSASHVVFTTGFVQDLAKVAAIAKRHGALSIVDAYQGTGQVPTDVREAGVDILLTGGLKWLLGGTGIVYMYVRRERIAELTPQAVGWFGNEHQWDFDPERFTPRKDAQRFETGTPPVPSVFAGSAGLDLIAGIGVPRIRRRMEGLVEDLVERARDRGLKLLVPEDPAERSAIVCVASADPKRDVARLAKKDIIVDARPGRVRISPYFYNTEEENELVVAALKER